MIYYIIYNMPLDFRWYGAVGSLRLRPRCPLGGPPFVLRMRKLASGAERHFHGGRGATSTAEHELCYV